MIGECSYCYIARGFGAKKCPYCGRILRRAPQAAAFCGTFPDSRVLPHLIQGIGLGIPGPKSV